MSFIKRVLKINSPRSKAATITGSIGLDLRLEDIQLVQLEQQDGAKLSIRALASLPYSVSRSELLSTPKMLKTLLQKALKEGDFQGKQIISTLPSDDVKIMPLNYFNNSQDVEITILELLSDRIDGEINDYVIDYIPIRSNSKEEEQLVLVALAKREVVLRYLDVFNKAGVEVQALDVGPAAIARLVSAMSSIQDPETVLVINFGNWHTYLTMISGRRLLYDQRVDLGEDGLLQHISSTLDIPKDETRNLVLKHGFYPVNGAKEDSSSEAYSDISNTLHEIVKPYFLKLVDEINRVMIFTASQTRGMPAGKVYLFGSVARWHGTDKVLNTMLEIPVCQIYVDYQQLFQDTNNDDLISPSKSVPEMAIATGLALRGMNLNE